MNNYHQKKYTALRKQRKGLLALLGRDELSQKTWFWAKGLLKEVEIDIGLMQGREATKHD